MLVDILLASFCLAHLTFDTNAVRVAINVVGHLGNSGLYTCLSESFHGEDNNVSQQLCNNLKAVLPEELGLKQAVTSCYAIPIPYEPAKVKLRLRMNSDQSSSLPDMNCISAVPLFKHLVSISNIQQRGKYAFVGPVEVDVYVEGALVKRKTINLEQVHLGPVDLGMNFVFNETSQAKRNRQNYSVFEVKILTDKPILVQEILRNKLEGYITYALLDVMPNTFGLKDAFVTRYMHMHKQQLIVKLQFREDILLKKGTDMHCDLFHKSFNYFLTTHWKGRSLFDIKDVTTIYNRKHMVINDVEKLHYLPSEITVFIEGKLHEDNKLVKGCHPDFQDRNSKTFEDIEQKLCSQIAESFGDVIKQDCLSSCYLLELYHQPDSSYRFKFGLKFSALFLRTSGLDYGCQTFTQLVLYELLKYDPRRIYYHYSRDISVRLKDINCGAPTANPLYMGQLTITGLAGILGDPIRETDHQKHDASFVKNITRQITASLPSTLSFAPAVHHYFTQIKYSRNPPPQTVLTIDVDEDVLRKHGLDLSCQTYFTIIRQFVSHNEGKKSEYAFYNISSIGYGRTLKTVYARNLK